MSQIYFNWWKMFVNISVLKTIIFRLIANYEYLFEKIPAFGKKCFVLLPIWAFSEAQHLYTVLLIGRWSTVHIIIAVFGSIDPFMSYRICLKSRLQKHKQFNSGQRAFFFYLTPYRYMWEIDKEGTWGNCSRIY